VIAAALVMAAALAVAAVSIVGATGEAERERDALILFVCESVRIREETDDPSAAIFRARFNLILAGLGENRCAKGDTQ